MNYKIRRLVESGIMIALATVLSFITIHFPFGGSISLLSMLPLVVIAYRHGTPWGLISGAIYGLIQIFCSSTAFNMFLPDNDSYQKWAIIIILLDYIIAYTAVGFSGIFRKRLSPGIALSAGAVVGLSLRYIVHIISGAIFYGQWASWFFEEEVAGNFGNMILSNFSGTALSIIYSIIYNGLYMIPEIIMTAVAAIAVSRIPEIKKGID